MRTLLQGLVTLWALGLILWGFLYPAMMVSRVSAAAYPGFWESEAEQAAARMVTQTLMGQGFGLEAGIFIVSGIIILVLSRLLRPARES